MSILTYPLGFIGGGKVFYNGVMENSVMFDLAATGYLYRTITTAPTEPKVLTISFWFKYGGQSTIAYNLLDTYIDDNNTRTMVIIEAASPGNTLTIQQQQTGASSYYYNANSTGVLRDPGAWYHIVISIDCNRGVVNDIIKTYINGKVVIDASNGTITTNTLNTNQVIGWATVGEKQNIGGSATGESARSYMTDIYSIDGYALGPENFAENKNGAWIPKAYAGPPPLLTDSSPNTHALNQITANEVKLSYDQRYIGESSLHFPDVTWEDGLSHDHKHADFNFGTEPFTVDLWFYITDASPGGYINLWGGQAGPGFGLKYGTDRVLKWYDSGSSFGDVVAAAPAFEWNEWNHVTFTRETLINCTLYINGVQTTKEATLL